MKLSISLSMLILVLLSCTRSTDFGESVLSGEFIDVESQDTFSLAARTVINDSTLVFSSTNRPLRQLVGRMNDPVFGLSEAKAYFQLGINQIDNSITRFENATCDSVLIVFVWDSTAWYGNYRQGIELEVRELEDNIELQDYYARDVLMTKPDIIGSTGLFVPRPTSQVAYRSVFQAVDSSVVSVDTLQGAYSIQLDPAFGQRILETDSLILRSQVLFRDEFRGLEISATAASDGIVAYDFLTNSQVNLYYSYTDTSNVDRQGLYTMNVSDFCTVPTSGDEPSCVLFSTYSHDYTGTPVQDALDNPQVGDSTLYLQSLIGTALEIELPTQVSDNQVLLSKATLILTVDDENSNDLAVYPEILRLLASYKDGDDEIAVLDLALSNIFDGTIRTDSDNDVTSYELNITAHMQQVIEGTVDNTLRITANQRSTLPRRTVLKGVAGGQGAARLVLVYTEQ